MFSVRSVQEEYHLGRGNVGAAEKMHLIGIALHHNCVCDGGDFVLAIASLDF